MTHELKIRKQWADAKLAGEKPFEIRVNDRGFQKGDIVRYKVVDPKTGEPWRVPAAELPFDGNDRHPLERCDFIITYVIEGKEGLERGYCVFADQPATHKAGAAPRDSVLAALRERASAVTRPCEAKPEGALEGLCECWDLDKKRRCPHRLIKSAGDQCFNPGECEGKRPVSADLRAGATPSNGTETPLAPPSPLAEIAQ